jgi:cytochrome c-type biogenesis protein CcsB
MFADGREPVPGAMLLLAEKREPPSDVPEASRTAVADAWRGLVNAWIRGDAAGVNTAVVTLAAELPKIDANGYPEADRLAWEHWYFSNGHMTKTWLVYLAASVLLLVGFIYKWPKARAAGFVVFTLAALLHTAAVLLRWYIAGRWPNSNMFEAVTTASWMGAALAVVAEVLLRRLPVRGLFALGASVGCMLALMACALLPAQLNPAIGNMMPVLNDVWLYIHTNVIIFSYALIFMAAVTAAMYLVWRWRGGVAVHARVGGAGEMLALAGGDGAAGQGRVGEILDGVTMTLMELSFVLLWAGIAMGAIWADHSWGRPWGWDPKEVFALNTFVVFAVLVHVRWRSKDKGLWTAVLAVIGAAVMLFNWIVINFVITGLHSYA